MSDYLDTKTSKKSHTCCINVQNFKNKKSKHYNVCFLRSAIRYLGLKVC